MRAPLAHFRSEIAAYRQRLITNPAPVHVRNRWRYEFTMAILDRWERHHDADKIWTEIFTVIESKCSAAEFIAAITRDRLQAEELARMRERMPGVEAKMRAHARRYAQDFQNGDHHANEVAAFNEVQERKGILGREKTAPRTRFMARWRANFEQLSGKPHDRLVANLTNVLFDLQGDDEIVTAEGVRTAARRMLLR